MGRNELALLVKHTVPVYICPMGSGFGFKSLSEEMRKPNFSTGFTVNSVENSEREK